MNPRPAVLVLGSLLCCSALATPVASDDPHEPSAQVAPVTVTLQDGQQLSGRVRLQSDAYLVLDLDGGGQVTLNRTSIASIAASGPNKDAPFYRVKLRDGQELLGRLVSQTPDALILELTNGAQLTLGRQSVRSFRPEERASMGSDGDVWLADPNRTRYLYGPSAMMLKQGEAYFSQKELLFSALAVGLTDNVSILVGSALPLLAFGNFVAAVKVGAPVAENLHGAFGAEAIMLPGLGGMGFVFGAGTYGNADTHLTISAGKPFFISEQSTNFADWIVTVSGNVRVHRHVAFVSENWIIGPMSAPTVLNSLALRAIFDRWAVDFGVVRIPFGSTNGGVGLFAPWLDLAYNFDVG